MENVPGSKSVAGAAHCRRFVADTFNNILNYKWINGGGPVA
jgi:hypothetical protein